MRASPISLLSPMEPSHSISAIISRRRAPWRRLSEPDSSSFEQSACPWPPPRGRTWRERNFSRVWERLQRRAAKEGVRPFPWHWTRHTHISWALEAGGSSSDVASWVGASLATIEAQLSPLRQPVESTAADGRAPPSHRSAPRSSADRAPRLVHQEHRIRRVQRFRHVRRKQLPMALLASLELDFTPNDRHLS